MSEIKKRTVIELPSQKVDPCCEAKPFKPSAAAKSRGTKRSLGLKTVLLTGLSWISGFIVINILVSYLLTETLTYGYKNRYTNWRTYFPVNANFCFFDGWKLPFYLPEF